MPDRICDAVEELSMILRLVGPQIVQAVAKSVADRTFAAQAGIVFQS